VFVAVLALIWAMLLVPSLFRGRLVSSPIDGVRSFERSMGVLANTRKQKATSPGRWIMVPRSEVTQPVRRRSRVIRRRRQNFERMLIVAGVTLVLGFVPALRWMWFVHLAVDAGIGLYVARLLRWKHDEEERNRVVTPLIAEVTAGDEEQQQSQLG
jgi:hypothetical protein